jgi:hypothetical protein
MENVCELLILNFQTPKKLEQNSFITMLHFWNVNIVEDSKNCKKLPVLPIKYNAITTHSFKLFK